MNKAIAVATIIEETPLLPHFIKHYERLDVDRIILCTTEQLAERINSLLSPKVFLVTVAARNLNQQFDEWKNQNENFAIKQHGEVDKNDYKLCLDVDEFHEYPLPLKLLMKRMNEGRIDEWGLAGYFVDRFGPNYSTPEVDKDRDLFEQFPVADPYFSEMSGACPRKIMICRVHCDLGHGRHHMVNGYFDRHNRVGVCVAQFNVHHFKWAADCTDRLKERIADPNHNPTYVAELKSQLDLLRKKQLASRS